MLKRAPDKEITHADGSAYLHRWYIIPKNRFFNIYLHHFLSSDEDRALHDHPWWSLGMILSPGKYWEHLPDHSPAARWTDRGEGSPYPRWEIKEGTMWSLMRHTHRILRHRFQPVLRRAKHIHRIELCKDDNGKELPVWTLFITGPHLREWGFWCPKGFVHWQIFTKATDTGNTVGKGCDD